MTHFFRALNPCSKASGIPYATKPLLSILTTDEIQDLLPHEIIKSKWQDDLYWYETLDATYTCLAGDHYDIRPATPHKTLFEQIMTAFFRPYLIPVIIGTEVHTIYNRKTGTKGVLDYLLFPLLARKLISDTKTEERKNTPIINALAWAVAIPLEVARHSLALALTIAILPIVALVHIIRNVINALSNEYTVEKSSSP